MLEDAAAVVAVLALALAALLALLAIRRRTLTRVPGVLDCSVRPAGNPRWALSVARFSSHRVECWKVFSLSWRPSWRWERATFDVLDRRWPDGTAGVEVHGPAVLLHCDHDGQVLDLALTADAYLGFASWLEAAPPGPATSVT